MNRIKSVVDSRNKRIKEIREEDGTLVITSNDVPAGMGCTRCYEYVDDDNDPDEDEDEDEE